MEAFDVFIDSLFTLDRWPFWSAVLVFTLLGQFFGVRLFTRERAYQKRESKYAEAFWYWGRETLLLQPILGGVALGSIWRDPEGAHWPLIGSQMYFSAAGAVALFAWTVLKAVAKRKGVELILPGSSSNPPPPNTVQ
jgi:hypothetical protein